MADKRLNRTLLKTGFQFPADVTHGRTDDLPIKVLQFGEGNFLRAFIDWMIDVVNSKNLFEGSVAVVQPLEKGLTELINHQDGLYTLLTRGIRDGKVEEDKRIITSVRKCIDPYKNWQDTVSAVQTSELKFVFSNTTEAGIAYKPEPYIKGSCPASFPAKLTSLLYERYLHYKGDKDKGLIIFPCELIAENGHTLKEYVLRYADDWKLDGEFIKWIDKANHFLSTLVDRIVPGYPVNEVEKIQAELGYRDDLIDTSEIFHLFVIEGPGERIKDLESLLPFAEAGLNVVWTDDMTPYRKQKVRFLNGAHTSCVLGAFLSGLDTVGEMMDDDVFGRLVKHIVFEEIMVSLEMDERTMYSYAKSVLERFRNPFIRHELLSISLNSVSKWKVRVMPTLLDYVRKKKCLPNGISFSLAALIAFYRVQMTDGQYYGERNGEGYAICDNSDVLEFFNKIWNVDRIDYKEITNSVLGNLEFWDYDLTQIDGLVDYVANALKDIIENGVLVGAKNLSPSITTYRIGVNNA
jgi:tagaturonate reductase